MPYTVTQRIKVIQQPAGGYIPVSAMCVKQYRDNFSLNIKENIPANYVGLAVDYLTRFRVTGNVEESFDIPILGAKILFHNYGMRNEFLQFLELLESVKAGDIYINVKRIPEAVINEVSREVIGYADKGD